MVRLEQQELSLLVGIQSGYSHFGKQSGVLLYKIKHTLIPYNNHAHWAPKHVSKAAENLSTQNPAHKCLQSSYALICQNLEATKKSLSR